MPANVASVLSRLFVTLWTVACQSVHGVLQARTLQWVAMPSCRGFPQPRDQIRSPVFPVLVVSSWKACQVPSSCIPLHLADLPLCDREPSTSNLSLPCMAEAHSPPPFPPLTMNEQQGKGVQSTVCCPLSWDSQHQGVQIPPSHTIQ